MSSIQRRKKITITSVMYPAASGSHFDLDYCAKKHLTVSAQTLEDLGLREIQILRGIGSLDGGGPAFRITALLTFGSTEGFQKRWLSTERLKSLPTSRCSPMFSLFCKSTKR